MAPFRGKIGGRRLRKGEHKNYRFVSFLPDAEQKMPKKKAKKLKKIPLWHHFKPKQFGKGQEREKIKITVSFRSYRTRYRKFQKKSKKIKKKTKKHHYGIISRQNCLENCKKVRNKNYSFVPSLPDA